MSLLFYSLILVLLFSYCDAAPRATSDGAKAAQEGSSVVTIEQYDQRLSDVLDPRANASVVVEDSLWVEGPLFLSSSSSSSSSSPRVPAELQDSLLFSDVRDNAIFAWSEEGEPLRLLAKPSGFLSSLEPDASQQTPPMWEPGSNGLALDSFGNLVACQHGDRRVAFVPLSELAEKTKTKNDDKRVLFRPVASRFKTLRFNSPNDLVFHPTTGDLWFTDPIYGLEHYGDDPLRETKHCGVYRVPAAAYKRAVGAGDGAEKKLFPVPADDSVELEISALPLPNGIAFSPDGRTLFVSNSGKEENAFWASFEIDLGTGKVKKNYCSNSSSSPLPSLEEDGGTKLFDVSDELKRARQRGDPVNSADGLKVSAPSGYVFASAVDGVFVFGPRFERVLGKIRVGDKVGNVAFGGEDGRDLFIAAGSRIIRVKTKTRGVVGTGV